MKLKILCLFMSLLLLGQSLVVCADAVQTTSADAQSEKAGQSYMDVPMYFQEDYPEVTYGQGTIATHGSGITSLAMVASYLKGQEYLPDTLAKRYQNLGTDDAGKLDYISLVMSLPCKKTSNPQDLLAALAEGRVAIAQVGGNSIFSVRYHYIVLTGFTDDGRVMVNDPMKSHYEDSLLQEGFRVGFAQEDILQGCSGGWIYGAATVTVHIHGDTDSASQPEEEQKDTQEEKSPAKVVTAISEDAVFSKNQVPLYFQTDYPNVRYGFGTVASSGCSVTSLAMVATYMTGHKYTPDELAGYCGGYGENNIARLEYGSDLLQLPWSRAENIHDVMDALGDGKLVIVLMGPESIFTQSQHFLVLTGLTEDGKILVHDSYEPNYSHWMLKKGFEEGFSEASIIRGYSGAWIYDVNAMPETPFIYMEDKPMVTPRYPDIDLTWEEQQLLARMIWVEARGESREGQQAVAEVVFNRMMSDHFADNLRDVIYAEGQFESVPYLDEAEPYQAQYEALEDALSGPYVLPEGVVYFSRSAVNENVWGKIGGHVFCYFADADMSKLERQEIPESEDTQSGENQTQ